ncbi:20151_t:CDS:2 [Racocetra fulgida]|uniref:20151_t:CDS:1 n=1 Tax=Racocetra fulgida TaxID=60492 RepID=A0A9N9GLK1_9GLOM|nr:20151_t:CDS:2 [Racocetra fulgida]
MDQKFVSSTEIEEARKKRAEEWKAAYERLGEKEEYDPRTLYEKLQEQKMKKEEAFQEMTRFSNLIHRLDEDEIDFLATLEHEQRGKEMEKMKKVEQELEEFRRSVFDPFLNITAAKADEEAAPKLIIQPETISAPIKTSIKKDAQRMILESAIKKINVPSRKRSLNDDETHSSNSNEQSKDQKRSKLESHSSRETTLTTATNNITNNTLASLLAYSDNSSSEESTSDDES